MTGARRALSRVNQPVAHRAEPFRETTAHGCRFGRNAADRETGGEQRVGVILIVDGQIQQDVFPQKDLGERGEKPRGERIRVDGRGDVQQRFIGACQIAGKVVFEQGGTPQVLQ